MDYLKILSVILDPLSGPNWWLSLGLNFLIILASTASKIFLFLQNLITSKQLKISLWFWQILYCSICEKTALFVGFVYSLILTNSCRSVKLQLFSYLTRSPRVIKSCLVNLL